MSINKKQSFTEYNVESPQRDFTLTFKDYNKGYRDRVNVTLDGVPVEQLGYTVRRVNPQVIQVEPPIPKGVVRLQRETDVDVSFYKFTSGALFTPLNMDQNFEQILHSQQEIRNQFVYTVEYVNSTLREYDKRVSDVETKVVGVQDGLKKEIKDRIQGDLDSRRYAEDLLGMGQIWDGISSRTVWDYPRNTTQEDINTLALNPVDSSIKTWSGKTQEQRNRYVVYAADFGLVADGKTDDSAAIQRAIDYAQGLRGLMQCRVCVNISGNIFLKSTRRLSSGWGYSVIVPSGIDIVGDACIYSTHDYANRTVHFLVRGSNIHFTGLTFAGSSVGKTSWSIPIGGGTSYDWEILAGVYSNIQVSFCTFTGSWLSVSFQSGTNGSQDVIFDGIDIIGCTSIATMDTGSAGNFNVRSDPPHKVRNVRMLGCTGKNGRTASSFNYVGIKGGTVTDCTSYNNAYAGCEVENGCEGIHISNLRSYDDAMGLWIDDSRWITFDGIFGHYTTDSMESPLHGSLGAYRRLVMITKSGFPSDKDFVTTGIVGRNLVGINCNIYAAPYGGSKEGAFGSINLSGIEIDNTDAAARGFSSGVFNMTGSIKHLTLVDINVLGAANGARELALGATGTITIRNVHMDSDPTAQPSDITGTARLHMDNVSLKGVNRYPSGHVESSNLVLDGVHTKTNRSGSFSLYYAQSGNPEGNQVGSLSSVYVRVDDPAVYIKRQAAGQSTGWSRIALLSDINKE